MNRSTWKRTAGRQGTACAVSAVLVFLAGGCGVKMHEAGEPDAAALQGAGGWSGSGTDGYGRAGSGSFDIDAAGWLDGEGPVAGASGAPGPRTDSGINPLPATMCGNGIIDQGEQCDGVNLQGATCLMLGFAGGGVLACHGFTCTYNVSGCQQASCGNGIVEQGEQCDGDNLYGESCASLGHGGGQLYCSVFCTFDVNMCVDSMRCGDGVVQEELDEFCDGDDLNGMTCVGLGYQGGTLSCDTATCRYDTSMCWRNYCVRGVCR